MAVDRDRVLRWFVSNRERSAQLFSLVDESCYYERPISLRNPIVFYEGHLPGFNLNTHVKRALKRPGVDEALEQLFERGIDPDDVRAADQAQASAWPSRGEIAAFVEAADALMTDALRNAELERAGDPMLERGLSVYTSLEHEAMHHETLLYMFHRLDVSQKKRPEGYSPTVGGLPPTPSKIEVPAGVARLGARREELDFGWDNEFTEHLVEVPGFRLDAHNVTNAQYLDFVSAGGYDDPSFWSPDQFRWLREDGLRHPLFWEKRDGEWYWRGMFDLIPLPPSWPVHVSHAEAAAYARWRGERLMSEAEFHRAAFGTPSGTERAFPWGDEPADSTRGNFDFQNWDPVPAGSFPAGASAWGVHDLVGNGWEWTSTLFEPFPGFRPMASYPQYSADFFDGKHYVMKGGSPVTAAPLLRRSFRNWFRPIYPYVYATFRCAV